MIVAALLVLLAATVALMAAPDRFRGRSAAGLGAAASALTFVLLALAWDGKASTSGEVDVAWIDVLNARFHLGLDGVSWPLALLTAFLTVLCCWWLARSGAGPAPSARFVALLLVVEGSSIGVFASLDLLLFFVFFELALIPMWFVIAYWGDPKDQAGRRRAATRFLLFTVTGSAVLLVGIVVVAIEAGSLQIADVQGTHSVLAASLIAIGLAVKVPIVPLHTWLPDAHGKAPTVGSVLLAGVFLKLGTYGLIRLDVQMLPSATAEIAPYLAAAGVVGIIWAGLVCLVQDDLKRLVAYSSIGHMGFVVLALATMTEAGVTGAVFGSVAHGLVTGLLFFLAGGLKDVHGTASLTALGRGLYERTRWFAVALLVAGLATMGLPGLAGFWGEYLSLRGAYEEGALDRSLAWTLLGVATIGIVLATAYVARFVRMLLQGEPTPIDTDRDLRARGVVVALVVPILVLGLWPTLLTDLLGSGVMGTSLLGVGR
ncbi:complex I subunit 4 family protein [Aeromicrobium terrae]|uniref:NADH-quinone oxidoreductase subunit M n=1 Tax=Aeromicrobium terrae TaxID=2498846 RepID=A0A5C8NHB5_9ACTN|nr:NADH-quinone oxidoreductase subunit M [Aeromicrobium terrae]TXL57998.1 NADH-quinone oxidoreductase subunit M [Aeromicrobium terrae]